ncbi:hypothetical protein HPB47_005875 [Ixodes persulcatus]|uniref:Uncharacterized protein n=1 Tax=Ixodes persulcatus TaxID=34615 RepID=A0AC60PBS3_IXOPE|nr:hypothetical protein HPB47_005875 [Ixodes persulcatus]
MTNIKMKLTYDFVQQLQRLDIVIKEALRTYPPVVLFVSRVCRGDTTVLGQFFPARVNVPWYRRGTYITILKSGRIPSSEIWTGWLVVRTVIIRLRT